MGPCITKFIKNPHTASNVKTHTGSSKQQLTYYSKSHAKPEQLSPSHAASESEVPALNSFTARKKNA